MILDCIIVDDELIARKSLERLCSKSEALHIVKICENATEALEYLEENPVDLIFLDVEMPGLSGIELMDHLAVLPNIILTTSKTDYAFEAYQYQVVDYLKKPITFPRFEQAVQKVIEIELRKQPQGDSTDIYLRENGRYVRVPINDILYVENAGDYVCIRTEKKSHIVHGTIKSIDSKLNHEQFMKVHRSYIVNLEKIVDIEDSTLVIADKVIPISRAHKALLLGSLNLL